MGARTRASSLGMTAIGGPGEKVETKLSRNSLGMLFLGVVGSGITNSMASAVNHVNGVWKKRCDRVEGLDGSARAAGKIEDDRFRTNSGNSA